MEEKQNKTIMIIHAILIALLIGGMIYACIYLWPYFVKLKDPVEQEKFREWITNLGIGGVFVLLGIQIIQILIPVIPGQIVEALSGVMFGPYFGTFICIVGVVITTIIVYGLIRVLGKPFVDLFVSKKSTQKWKFLENAERVEAIFMFLFLLPAMPKDILIFIAAIVGVKLKNILIVSAIARIPSILLVAYCGDFLIQGNTKYTLIMIAINLGISFVGLIFNKKIITWLQTHFIQSKPKEE